MHIYAPREALSRRACEARPPVNAVSFLLVRCRLESAGVSPQPAGEERANESLGGGFFCIIVVRQSV